MSTFPAAAADVADNSIGSFEIVRFEVEGSTFLPSQTIDTLLAPFTGKHRGFADVERAVEALQDAYHRRGLKLVQVVLPEQELNGGVVRLQVIETHIGKVVVEGNTVFDQTNIRHSLPGLREGGSPDLDRISASLKLANESPGQEDHSATAECRRAGRGRRSGESRRREALESRAHAGQHRQ